MRACATKAGSPAAASGTPNSALALALSCGRGASLLPAREPRSRRSLDDETRFHPTDRDDGPVKEDPPAHTPVILGIDDLRPLPRATRIARTSSEGIQLLQEHRGIFIDELWVDHDLGGDDTILPVVALLEEAAFNDRPFHIGTVFVHSANPIGAETVVRSLSHWRYNVRRATA